MSLAIEIPADLKSALRKFRFARRKAGNAAFVVKINKQKLIMEEADQFDSISFEELGEELPENSPRYIVLTTELSHDDGRKSFPLLLINWVPSSCNQEMSILHASGLLDFQNTAEISRVLEIRDGAEGLTKEAVDAALR